MTTKTSPKQPVALLRTAFVNLTSNPILFFPLGILLFLQFLILEIIFFAPRYPLSLVFQPLIRAFAGEIFAHYPFNFILLARWFQAVQGRVYVLGNSYVLGMFIGVIAAINSDKKVNWRTIVRRTTASYIHLVLAALLMFLCVVGLSKIYGLLIARAVMIRSTSGIFFIIKRLIISAAPYFTLLFSILVTTLFAFVFPVIILEKKKIFAALAVNFKILKKAFWTILAVNFLAGLLYAPVIILETSRPIIDRASVPELWGGFIVLSVIVALLIDALQYTAITTYYLLTKES